MRGKLGIWLKVVAWVAFGFLMLVVGVLVSAVKVLTPDRLTPMVQTIANRSLRADVSVQKVELSLRQSFPFLNLDVDDMVVRSRDILALPAPARDTLPQWADTLLAVERLHGGINVFRAIGGVIDLKDLRIERPKVNVLAVNDSLNNFSISQPSDAPDTSAVRVPDIRLNRFSIIDPSPIHYSDMAQHTFMTIDVKSAELTNSTEASAAYQPLYHVDFDSNVKSPLLEIVGQKDINIGFDGVVEWSHDKPYQLGLKDFKYALSLLQGSIDTRLDFSEALKVESLKFTAGPLSVADFLALVPDSIAKEYYIPVEISTNAMLKCEGALTQPYVVGSVDWPVAEMNVEIPPCRLKYDKLDLDNFELGGTIYLCGGTPNDARIKINKINMEGAGVALKISGTLTEILSDPLFDGDVDGEAQLSRLPADITNLLHASLTGKVTANTTVVGRPSMLSRDGFHNLRLAGEMEVDDFVYIADDTLSLYHLGHADMVFGTHQRLANTSRVVVDSLLTAKLTVDTADILVSGIDIKVSKMRLGVGAQNKNTQSDTTLIIPMGGRLTARSLSIFSISDTAGVKISGIDGSVSMRRYKNDAHLPQFKLNLGMSSLSTGNNRTRFMANDGSLHCTLSKLPDTLLTKNRREVRHLADSLHRRHPHLSVDSVYAMALEIRRRTSRPGHHRVHTEMSTSDAEIIEWGTSSGMRRLLLDWSVEGGLTAQTARLFTTAFPVRNRLENLNINFNNDSISLTDIKYKAGRSDFLISGNITNIKRAFTSRRQPNSLRVHFNILSDFIDVNELSHALFSGSAHRHESFGDKELDVLDKPLDDSDGIDSDVAPLLIPTNIDAELSIEANSVEYADIVLNDFKGTVLMYDGALNLHDLSASSKVGSVNLSALYSAPSPKDIDFGFGMELHDFNISNFLKLVPAIDSVMPMMRDLSGIVSANLAVTSKINHNMDLVLPSMKAAINLKGDSVAFLDSVTFKKVAKWLLFKNKEQNMIDHVSAQMIVEDGEMRLFPFIFDFDRYKLGIQGYNDFNMNLNYHIAVLKSPIPFKFGINISGNYDKLKIRLGGAKFNEKTTVDRSPIVNDTRINLINQFQNVFRRGVRNSKFATLDMSDKPLAQDIDLHTDTLSAADSVFFRSEGLIPE